jgi:RNA polymerase sigma-70 factor (ECF subfamily)
MSVSAGRDELLERMAVAVEARFSGWRIERNEFIRRLESILDAEQATGGPDLDLAARVEKLSIDDVYLAYGCLIGIPGAIASFARTYLPRIDEYLRCLPRARLHRDEVQRRLEDLLLLPQNGAPPRIGQYRGRAPLDHFVAAVARNAALTLLRSERRGQHVVDIDRLALPANGTDEPGRYASGLYEAVVRDAVRSSLATLDRRQRTTVRLHLSGGVTFTQIARMLRVHQSTVSRSFDAAMLKLHADVLRQLRTHGLCDAEIESVIRDVRSHIDLSISRVLRDTDVDD